MTTEDKPGTNEATARPAADEAIAQPVTSAATAKPAPDARWTDEFLDGMRHQTDPEADTLARTYFESFPTKEAGMKALFALKKAYLDVWDAPMPHDLDPGIRAYFERPVRYPDWVDPARIDVASDLFVAYGPISLMTLLLASAPMFWTNPAGAHAFYVAAIFSPASVSRRLKLLPLFVLNFALHGRLAQTVTTWPPYQNDPALPPGFSVTKGKGIITVQKLRMAHAVHRIVLTQPHPDPVLNWDKARFGEPINQEDLAQATMHFCFTTIDGLAKLGIEQSADEQEATFLAWKTVSFLLGLRPELQPADAAEGRALLEASLRRHERPTSDGVALIKQELAVVRKILPWPLRTLPGALMRYLLGPKYADMLEVPNPRITLWFLRTFRWLWKDHDLFAWIAERLSPRLIRWFDTNRKVVSQLKL